MTAPTVHLAPVLHYVVVAVPDAFHKVILKEGGDYSGTVLRLAVIGADCQRQHTKKDDHQRRGKKK